MVYKVAIMVKLDNILNNVDGLNEDDRAWIDAMMANGLDAIKERDELKWGIDNDL